MKILGIWDGHDAGAALLDVHGRRVVCAVNEERLSRRKLEVGFPERSIRMCLDYGGIHAEDVGEVVASTTDFAKTLTRALPVLKQRYYLQRRRKIPTSWSTSLTRRFKYRATTWPPGRVSRLVSRYLLRRWLTRTGLGTTPLFLVDHHLAHAACAARTSEIDESVVVTLDGVGDGLSGSFSVFSDSKLKRIASIGARDSLGVFFELVTQLMNMRELEDEGKVMALASYGYPPADGENPLLSLFSVDGLRLRCRFGANRLRKHLAETLSMMPSEQFAWLAQDVLEHFVCRLVENAVSRTGISTVVYAGGVASNIRVNLKLRQLDCVSRIHVFPHMGDGGLALGAALIRAAVHDPRAQFPLLDARLGPAFPATRVDQAIERSGLRFRRSNDLEDEVAGAIARGEVVMWYQGRMEFGPRALGGRSILARPDDPTIRDRLNLSLKRRVWYQPFCPSMLYSEAAALLEGAQAQPNRYMTMAYRVNAAARTKLAGVMSPDGTCRPQLVDEGCGRFYRLLVSIKKKTGVGAVLNTSFNLHGEPIVATPEEAIRTFESSGADWLVLDEHLAPGTHMAC